ncbi:ABC transporter permease [Flavisphingomonas formosensis]|uniref:ABC transporter permease n=1 Tax=Flavisphingomonas formosensis TaxID=861534 RepID=UPI0012FB5043|nr:ABC transporter permease [Sphingomonas formosensis]
MSGTVAAVRRRHNPFAGAGRIAAHRIGNFLAFLLALGLIWQLLVTVFAIPRYLLPPPPAVLAAFGGHGGAILQAAGFTVLCTSIGMVISVVIAITLAIAFIASDRLSRALMPLIILIRTVPMIAVAPLIILIFGRGPANSIGMVALLTFFQIMLAAKRGFLSPSPNAMEMMHTYGASFWQIQLKVRVPFAIPYIFTGLRIASGSAILCAMFAEWLSGAPGLGMLILESYSVQDFPLMWAAVLTSTTAAYLFFTLTLAMERLVLDWSR